ncbi:MAG: folate-binding protein [Acidobacteriota bacterium]|nr:folate-binding protein [Acidobacteriota bacterium]
MSDGYDALRAGAAFLDLSDRGRIYVTGEDRARLLHAMTTNHVQQLTPGTGLYAFFLNAQGRILGDVNLYCFDDRLLLDTEPETREYLYQHLDKFIIADDATLDDATARTFAIALEGPGATALLTAIGAPIPEEPYAHAAWESWTIARDSVTGADGFRFFGDAETKAELISKLTSAGAVPASAEQARAVRLEHFKPRYGEDIHATTLPQETTLAKALHFKKGCYLGQEIVERIRSRGHVNRVLVGLEIEGRQPVPAGTKLTSEGKEIGEVTSSAYSPALGKVVALAYARVQAIEGRDSIEVNGANGAIRRLPRP